MRKVQKKPAHDSRCKRGDSKTRKKATSATRLADTVTQPCKVPNMNMLAFEATAGAARLKLTKAYTTMPSYDDLHLPDALVLLVDIVEVLRGVPTRHRRTWQKMLARAFPELAGAGVAATLQTLVVRCWQIRASIAPIAMHDFIEFCAGDGNLTAECLKLGLHGAALDVLYREDHNMITRLGLRTMLDCISETIPGALTWWGTRCSSFVSICKKHHGRSEANEFWGNTHHAFVQEGNTMQVPLMDGLLAWFGNGHGFHNVTHMLNYACLEGAL